MQCDKVVDTDLDFARISSPAAIGERNLSSLLTDTRKQRKLPGSVFGVSEPDIRGNLGETFSP